MSSSSTEITARNKREGPSEFARELPCFEAAVWNIFNPYELAGYLTALPRPRRSRLRQLLYVHSAPHSRCSA
jgi:hypothetical protein